MKLDTIEDVYAALRSCYANNMSNKLLAFKCVERAKYLKDLDLEFKARYRYLRQLVFNGYDEEAITLFPWLLNMCDQHPDRFNYGDILWAYKWIVDDLYNYGSIALAKADAIFQDFETRFRDYGAGEKVLYEYKMTRAFDIGDIEIGYKYLKKYKSIPKRGTLDNCKACVANYLVEISIDNFRYDEAVKEAKYILNNNLKCTHVPRSTYAKLVYAYLILDKKDLADKYYQLSSKLLKGNKKEFFDFSYILPYLTISKKYVEGRHIIENQLKLITKKTSDLTKCSFYHACSLFFLGMFRNGKKKIKLQLPPYITACHSGNVDQDNYLLEDLINYFETLVKEHASALDIKNKNEYYIKRFAKINEDFICKFFK